MSEDHKTPPQTVRSPVHIRRTVYGDRLEQVRELLRCPVSGESRTVESCKDCPRLVGQVLTADGSFLECRARPDAGASGSGSWARFYQVKAADLMTRDVVCVDDELTLEEAATVFEGSHVRAAPVVDDEGRIVGIVSTSDLVLAKEADAPETPHAPIANAAGVLVEDVMTASVVFVKEDTSLAEVIQTFASCGVHRLPIVDAEEAVVGMLSMTDVLRWIGEELKASRGFP